METTRDYVRRLETLGRDDVPLVGGENASLGEMIRELKKEKIRIPGGFATTARVLSVMAKNGLKRGKKGLEVYMMCEIPSNIVLAEEASSFT